VNSTVDIDISTKVAFLRQSASYPGHPSGVDVIQTHMSWVFLTDRLVYKLKKPVRFEFLDFSTLERRHHDCQEEVRLNRRLAQGVYLGVTPLTVDAAGRLHLNGEGEAADWLVKMQRLPRERMLDHAIATGRADEAGYVLLRRYWLAFISTQTR
jgi:aminoglycoside phosphotransferase family enzyme